MQSPQSDPIQPPSETKGAPISTGTAELAADSLPSDGHLHSTPKPLLKRALAIYGPLGIFLFAWVTLFLASGSIQAGPNGKGFGGDFAIFYGAAHVMQQGGDPYDQRAIYRAESSLLRRQAVAVPRFQTFIRVGSPPLLFWAMRPLADIPFRTAAVVWIALMEVMLCLGCMACLLALGWTSRLLPTLVFLAMPQTVFAAYYGNVDGLVFAALAAAFALAIRFPLVAGAALSAAWLKPQVALPAALLLVLFQARVRGRMLAGFAAASGILAALCILATGLHTFDLWLGALRQYSRDAALQPDMASLTGLYVYWAAPGLRFALESLILGAAAALTATWWWKWRDRRPLPLLLSAWLWIMWFLAAPFAHFHDEVILAIPLLALLGRNGISGLRRRQVACMYLVAGSLLLFPTSRLHTDLQSLALIPVAALCFLEVRDAPQVSSELANRSESESLSRRESTARSTKP